MSRQRWRMYPFTYSWRAFVPTPDRISGQAVRCETLFVVALLHLMSMYPPFGVDRRARDAVGPLEHHRVPSYRML